MRLISLFHNKVKQALRKKKSVLSRGNAEGKTKEEWEWTTFPIDWFFLRNLNLPFTVSFLSFDSTWKTKPNERKINSPSPLFPCTTEPEQRRERKWISYWPEPILPDWPVKKGNNWRLPDWTVKKGNWRIHSWTRLNFSFSGTWKQVKTKARWMRLCSHIQSIFPLLILELGK